MKRRTLIASIGAVAGTSLGAAAYSSATVTRDATIDVATDSDALIGLEASSGSQYITNGDTGETLTIDISQGLNSDATFTFGSDGSDLATSAFSITNNGETDRVLTLSYEITDGDTGTYIDNNGTGPHLNFQVYDPRVEDGTNDFIMTESGDGEISAASPTEPYYVVLEIDTSGLASDHDLSGTLSIIA